MAVNKIVQQSREQAKRERYIEKNRILTVKESTDELRSCNCCGIGIGKRYELQIGHNGQSMASILCDECLSKLGDIIWEVS